MNTAVRRHLFDSYGRLLPLWVSVACEFTRTFAQRVAVVFIFAQATAYVAAGDADSAKDHIAYLFLVFVAGTVIGLIGDLLANAAADRRYLTLLLRYHKKLISKDLAFYRDAQIGNLANLFRQHLDGTMTIVRLLRTDVVKLVTTLLCPLLLLTVLNWRLGLVLTLLVLVQSKYVMWASSQATKFRKQSLEVYQKLNGEVADEVANIVALRSGGQEAEAVGMVASLAEEEARTFWQRHRMTVLLDLPRVLLTGFGIGIGCLLIVSGSAGGMGSVALVVMTFAYLLQVTTGVADMPDLVLRLDEHVARVGSTLGVLGASHESISDRVDAAPFHVDQGAIRFDNVSFAYATPTGAVPILENVSFAIRGGERVGIVGPNGAGKSTLVSLLMRFIDVASGRITIDGSDVREMPQYDLHAAIAFLPQEQVLLHRSVRDNIRFFRKAATEDEIVEAAKAADAHGFIMELEDGYNTVVGERGSKLSGGQRQRILLARAILKESRIIVFDEATSALDTESEAMVQQRLLRRLGESTFIVIAHRLSTVAHLDRILVLDRGRVVEEGTHEALIGLNGHYSLLWKRQRERDVRT